MANSGPTGTEHVARSQLDRYALFLIQSVIIKCEIQCSYQRVITLLNNAYLTANYITYIHAHCDRACARTHLPIPHIQFRMIITATCKSSWKIFVRIKHRFFWRNYWAIPRGEHCEFFDIKYAVIDFTQGAKVAGLSACPDFVTNGKHANSPFTKNVPNWRRGREFTRRDHFITSHSTTCCQPVPDWLQMFLGRLPTF